MHIGQAAPATGILPILKDLFVHHGHMVSEEAQLEGKSGTIYSVPLLAESETGAVLIGAHQGPEPLSAAEVEEFAATVADVAADRGVLCHLGAVDADAYDAADGVVLWGRDALTRILGEAQLALALGEIPPALPFESAPVPELLVAQQVADLTPESFSLPPASVELPAVAAPEAAPDFAGFAEAFAQPGEVAAESVQELPPATPARKSFSPWADMSSVTPAPAAPAPAPALAALEAQSPPPVAQGPPPRVAVPDSPFGMLLAASAVPAKAIQATPPTTPTFDPWNAPASSLQMPAAFAPPPPAARTYTRPLLPVRLKPEDAHKKVRDRLYSMSSAELVLHPVHLYDYECDLLQEGKLAFDTEDGRVQVHGSDKSTLDVDPDATNPDASSLLPAGHTHQVTERVLRITEERAAQLATAHVMKRHTRVVDVRVPDENHSLFYTERRKIEPKAEQIRLRPLGIFFRPAWRLHGDNGYVEVDAIDGRELDVQLVGSRHGAMVLE